MRYVGNKREKKEIIGDERKKKELSANVHTRKNDIGSDGGRQRTSPT